MSRAGVYVIAELSANHNNDYDLAVKTIQAMAEAAADAVKVQTYTADSLSMDVDNEYFGPKKDGPWKGTRPYDLFQEGSMPYDWQPKLKKVAEALGMEFFSSPFDKEAVDFLEEMGVPRYKIASFEITDIPLIEYTAAKKKPMIISTGVAEEEDIVLAIEACKRVGNDDITILKCTSEYPASIEDANLTTLPFFKERFGVKIGISDHTMGSLVPTVSVGLGATVIEKHFILDRNLGGPDSAFSMEPHEFADMVKSVRQASSAMGEVRLEVPDRNRLRRRSLFISRDIKEGEEFTLDNVRSVRPGHGLHPRHLKAVLGKKAKTALKKGTPLEAGMVND